MTIVSEEAFVPEEATAKAGTVTFFLRNDPGNTHNFLLGTAVDAAAAGEIAGDGLQRDRHPHHRGPGSGDVRLLVHRS